MAMFVVVVVVAVVVVVVVAVVAVVVGVGCSRVVGCLLFVNRCLMLVMLLLLNLPSGTLTKLDGICPSSIGNPCSSRDRVLASYASHEKTLLLSIILVV